MKVKGRVMVYLNSFFIGMLAGAILILTESLALFFLIVLIGGIINGTICNTIDEQEQQIRKQKQIQKQWRIKK